MTNSQDLQAPMWDNSKIFPSVEGPEIDQSMSLLREKCLWLEKKTAEFRPFLAEADNLREKDFHHLLPLAQEISKETWGGLIPLLRNLSTYLHSISNTDSKNELANMKLSLLGQISVTFNKAFEPFRLFMKKTSDDFVEQFLEDPSLKPEAFQLFRSRELREFSLPLSEENMETALNLHGHQAWEKLHQQISGTLRCHVPLKGEVRNMGLVETIGLASHQKDEVRKLAHESIYAAWATQQESCAAILNALAGWRHELYKIRSHQKTLHFLDPALHISRIQRETLECMLDTVKSRQDVARKANFLRAEVLGKKAVDIWDGAAPYPVKADKKEELISYPKAIEMIKDSFQEFHPDMAEFVDIMVKNNWIDGKVGENRRPGGYCTKFVKPQQPRIFMSYQGHISNVITLAHELGHAFHNWVMRDLHLAETQYPMTLAETASIFAENLFRDKLNKQVSERDDVLRMGWEDLNGAIAFLLNIPFRFDFEKAFYEKTQERSLTVDEIKQLCAEKWRETYQDSTTQAHDMFWTAKLHFYMSHRSFYNYPYTFGYLFALGVYSMGMKMGGDFYPTYINLLHDTGRMHVEDVAKKYLDTDLTKPDFWNASIDLVSEKVDAFEQVLHS